MEKAILKIAGMKCHSCAKIIKFALEDKQGVRFADIDFDSGTASLEFHPAKTSINEIRKTIEELGYNPFEN